MRTHEEIRTKHSLGKCPKAAVYGKFKQHHFLFQIKNLKYIEMGTGSMSHVKVCVFVCVCLSLSSDSSTTTALSVYKHQQILEEERKDFDRCQL